jgi:membrane-bound lytic murein transglycosylase D
LLLAHLKWKQILVVVSLTVAIAGPSYSADVGAESDFFPVYNCIQPNVTFWTKIYTQYSSDYGVIHDKRRLEIIYGTIKLEDPDRAGSRRINKRRIKKAKKKFKAILAKLRRGGSPAGPDEQMVADLFGPDAKAADFRSAMYNIRCQVGQKDRFQEGLVRSGAYIEEIKQIFRDAGLPEDLAYLPHVESSFNPKAYSKFGAAGMWQFTRSTGRRFMQIGYTIDERRDPILSSWAAAKLLHNNYQKLQSWPLAITAYNHGMSGMRRALRKKGSYDRIFKEYRSRIFRFASRNFYPEFLAACEAAKNYRQYFGDLRLDSPVRSREITLAGYVSLPQLAQHLRIDLAELRELNPALRHPVFRGQKYVPGGYRLRLPDSDQRDWEQLIAQLPPDIFRQNQKRSQIYTVRRGDTAGKIAKIHGVDLDELIAVNNLDRRATIYVNQTLRIPRPEEKPIMVAQLEESKKKTVEASLQTSSSQPLSRNRQSKDHATDQIIRHPAADQKTGMRALADDQATKKEMPAAAPESQPIKNPPQANQTAAFLLAYGAVSEIPAQYILPPEQIQEPDEEQPPGDPEFTAALADINGDSMEVKPDADKRPLNPEILQGHFAVERVLKSGGKTIGVIQVEAEETLGHYAEWLRVPARVIRRLNGFRYGRPLHLSQQIKIPLDRVSREEFEEKRFEFHQALAEDFFATYRVEKVLTYSIKRGDNIWTLSHQEFEVPLWLLKRYNADVDFGALIPSQKLLIPIVEKNV